jgi:hypothetical protein
VAVVDMMGVKGGNRSIAGDCPVGKMLSIVHTVILHIKSQFSFATGLSVWSFSNKNVECSD